MQKWTHQLPSKTLNQFHPTKQMKIKFLNSKCTAHITKVCHHHYLRITIAGSGRPLSRPLSSWCWRCVAAWPLFWRAWWAIGFCLSATLTRLQPLLHVRPSMLLSLPPNSPRRSASARKRSLMWVVVMALVQTMCDLMSWINHLMVGFILQVLQDILLKETADTLSDPQ